MKKIKLVFQYIYTIYAAAVFIILMLPVVIFSLVTPLFGKLKGGNLIYKACSLWGKIWYVLVGMHHEEIYLSPNDTSKQYIFIANHISYIDIPAIVRCMHQPVRVLGKYEMVKYPLFGIIYRMAVIIVDRKNAKTRAQSIHALKAVIHKGISIFIFPEGTFNETGNPLKNFYDGAFRIAIETQTPLKPLLFLDTLERMHYRGFFEMTPGKSRVVFMDEIDVSNYSLNDITKLKNDVHFIMEEALKTYRHYPAS